MATGGEPLPEHQGETRLQLKTFLGSTQPPVISARVWKLLEVGACMGIKRCKAHPCQSQLRLYTKHIGSKYNSSELIYMHSTYDVQHCSQASLFLWVCAKI